MKKKNKKMSSDEEGPEVFMDYAPTKEFLNAFGAKETSKEMKNFAKDTAVRHFPSEDKGKEEEEDEDEEPEKDTIVVAVVIIGVGCFAAGILIGYLAAKNFNFC